MGLTFTRERLIRFSHCDPAGIVYFVNFFDMVGGVVEDWFREAVGLPFQEMHLARRVGFPIVSTGCEFARPCHLGDTLTLELAIARLGRSSIDFGVEETEDDTCWRPVYRCDPKPCRWMRLTVHRSRGIR